MATAVLDDGTAVPVSTGTALPAGTSGVLRTERALRDGRTVHGPDVTALDLRRCGEEAAAGDRLLPGGTVVTPYVLALAATTGHDSLRVRPRPRVRILVTGDELLDAGLPREGRIRDALGPMLPDLIRVLGADPGLARVADDAAQFTAALTSRGEDVVVTTGGTAHGLRDHLRPLLASLGARYVVDEIRCRPGHPMLLAVLPDGRPLVGMPGNPFAAVAAALTLLDPLCAALTGRAPRSPLRARLDSDHRAHPTDTRLVPVVLTPKGLQPTGSDGPAMLRGIALADGLAIITPGADAVAGDEIEFLELPR